MGLGTAVCVLLIGFGIIIVIVSTTIESILRFLTIVTTVTRGTPVTSVTRGDIAVTVIIDGCSFLCVPCGGQSDSTIVASGSTSRSK